MSSELPRRFGAYTLLHVLGRGGSGTAYLAVPNDPQDGTEPVVLKTLHADAAGDAMGRERFEHEAKLAVATNVRAFAAVYDVGIAGGTPYIAMELVQGMSIGKLMVALAERDVLLALGDAVAIVRSTLSGLQELHEARDAAGELGAIHRDLSPNNLMLEVTGAVRILDLGVGRSRLREAKTATGVVVGTPGYMAPEQVLSAPISQRSDVYTMGTILWELLAGRRYIARGDLASMLTETVRRVFEPPSAFRPGLAPELDEICRRALRTEPEDRFAHAGEMLRALEAVRIPTADAGGVPLLAVYTFDLDPEVLDLARAYVRSDSEPTVIARDTIVLARRMPLAAPPAVVRSAPVPITAYLAVLAVVAAVLSAALWWQKPPSRPVPVQVPALPEVRPRPSPVPGVQPRAAEVAEPLQDLPEPEQPEPAPRPRKRPAAAATPDAATAPAEPSVEELMARLNELARATKRARPEVAGEVDELVNAGLFEAAGGDRPAVRTRLRAITARLESLKASGP